MKSKTVLFISIVLISFFVSTSLASAKARIYKQETTIYRCHSGTEASIYTKGAALVKVSRGGYQYYARRVKLSGNYGNLQKWSVPVRYSGKAGKKITIKVVALSKKGKNAFAKIKTRVGVSASNGCI